MNDFNDILANISRTLIFPSLLSIEEIILFLNSKKPRSHKNCHGYMLLKISIVKECRRLGTNDKKIIASATNYFWKKFNKARKIWICGFSSKGELYMIIVTVMPTRYLDMSLQMKVGE
ncbi:9130_t:CDS:2 [Diversispora eburnea]|uniref:9130_t:CDS:1 n=1 Tax=Diversispora eburnea TaxID=1213867 RepID=A0A9N9F1B1_9GLOM|nr:9130_t:CDS:2 [Diversispora eburnea]